MVVLTTTLSVVWTKRSYVFSLTCCLSSWYLIIGMYQFVYFKLHQIFPMQKTHWNCIIRFPFSAQVAPAPYAKATPIEVTKAMQQNQSILVSLAVSMNSSSRSFYMENNKLGWPIPNLKKLFSTAVAYKKKFKNGIISSWEDYNAVNNVSIF